MGYDNIKAVWKNIKWRGTEFFYKKIQIIEKWGWEEYQDVENFIQPCILIT